jgi:hypothetical protein
VAYQSPASPVELIVPSVPGAPLDQPLGADHYPPLTYSAALGAYTMPAAPATNGPAVLAPVWSVRVRFVFHSVYPGAERVRAYVVEALPSIGLPQHPHENWWSDVLSYAANDDDPVAGQ